MLDTLINVLTGGHVMMIAAAGLILLPNTEPNYEALDLALSINEDTFVEEVNKQINNCLNKPGVKADICLHKIKIYIDNIEK